MMNTDAAGVIAEMVISRLPARRMLRVSGVTAPGESGLGESGLGESSAGTPQLCQHASATPSDAWVAAASTAMKRGRPRRRSAPTSLGDRPHLAIDVR